MNCIREIQSSFFILINRKIIVMLDILSNLVIKEKYPNELPNDVSILISQEAVEIIEYTGQTLQVDTNRNKRNS